MHELGIARNVVAIVSEQAHGAQVLRVRLAVGSLAAVMPDALHFCFDVCAEGTSVAGAQLEIDTRPGRWHCRSCSGTFESNGFGQPCACGSHQLDCVGGEELKVVEMETA